MLETWKVLSHILAAMDSRILALQFVLAGFAAALDYNSPNVCPYTIKRNISIQKFKTFPVPCEREGGCQETRLVTVYELKEEQILGCCAGWTASGNSCSIPCPADRYGRNCSEICNCTAPNTRCFPMSGCNCDLGWKAPNCTSKCDPGWYGFKCKWRCLNECLNGALCDHVTGQCVCMPGWTGPLCNQTCPQGRYGNDCAMNCTCQGDRAICDHVNGECSCQPGWSGLYCNEMEGDTSSLLEGTLVEETANATELWMESDQDMVLSYPDYSVRVVIIVPVVAGIVIILGVFAVIMSFISKQQGHDKKRNPRICHPPGRVLSLGPTTMGGMGPTSGSLNAGQTQVLSVRDVDPLNSLPTDLMMPVAPLPDIPQEGTARRNKKDQLPPIHD